MRKNSVAGVALAATLVSGLSLSPGGCSPQPRPKQHRIRVKQAGYPPVIHEADGSHHGETIATGTRVELLDPEPDQFSNVRIKVLEGKQEGRSVRVHEAAVEEIPQP